MQSAESKARRARGSRMVLATIGLEIETSLMECGDAKPEQEKIPLNTRVNPVKRFCLIFILQYQTPYSSYNCNQFSLVLSFPARSSLRRRYQDFHSLKKHSTTMPGIMRFRCFRICLGIVLLLCLLYFKDMINNEPPLTRVVAPKQFPLHPSNVNTNRLQAKKSSISRRLQDFTHDWLRQRRARVDWKNIIKPCADNMAWGLVKDQWGKTNRSSATTSDIIFKDIRPAGEFSKIFIQSKTSDNRTKLIGGDTWRVYLRGPTSLVATVFDHNNGTYEALFLITEPGVYELMIYLDYSLCDGFKDPPLDWFIIGDDQGAHQREGVLGTLDEYLVKQPFETGQPNLTVTVTNAQLKGPLSGK